MVKDRKKADFERKTQELKDHYRNIDKELRIHRKIKKDKVRQFYEEMRQIEEKRNNTMSVPKGSRQSLSVINVSKLHDPKSHANF